MVISVIPLLVCDDSAMARKQLIRALPADWPVSITQAAHGEEALAAIRQGLGPIMLLDLTMPVLDGYQTLAALQPKACRARSSWSPVTCKMKPCVGYASWAPWIS